ncbi:hypothetical protein C4565_03300 [Candidatus Parcubacteria bacterium]|jgi:3D (Asp-Asp-Asp) domain-containing protein|nr:MAG: hypothetical protein C4565_03300 [Candidatus Parcubacteria bacterium]
MGKKLVTAVIGILIVTFPMPSETPTMNVIHTTKSSGVSIAHAAEVPDDVETKAIVQSRKVWITAYSSTPEETDDTPFITAMGTTVRDGIIATNLLPFGTQVKIPELFGNKVFVVEDRMHSRKKNNVDIWMSSKQDALEFGIAYTDIVILN